MVARELPTATSFGTLRTYLQYVTTTKGWSSQHLPLKTESDWGCEVSEVSISYAQTPYVSSNRA